MRRQDKMPARNKKNFRPTEKGAGMTRAGVAAYRRANPGSKLKTAVTGKVKPGSKAAKRRKSFCARSAGQMKKFPKAARMTDSQRQSAVARKRSKAQGVGGKPTNVPTFAKRKKAMMGGFMGKRMGIR